MIYFICALDDPECLVKIGYTKNDVEKRMEALQIGSPLILRLLLVIEGTKEVESDLHLAFAQERRRGEWFYPSPRLRQFIRRHLGEGFERELAEATTDEGKMHFYAQQLGWSVEETRTGIESLLAS